jgi:nucleotide sugar dehydrogenase
MAAWYPGPGVGGHCLPVDPLYLAWQTREQLGQPFRFAELAHEINIGRPKYVAQRAQELLGRTRRAVDRGAEPAPAHTERRDGTGPLHAVDVLVLGVAYKPNVADVRESPALGVVQHLRNLGARVTVSDPWVTDWAATPTVLAADLGDVIGDYPLTIVVTDHDAFDFDMIAARAPLVLDTRNSIPVSSTVVPL